MSGACAPAPPSSPTERHAPLRLIAHVGPDRAIAVTFLIPPFAIAWGAAFLGEAISGRMLAGSAVVIAGTALATGMVKLPWPRPAPVR